MTDYQVTSVMPAGGEYVTFAAGFYSEYRRYGPDAWEVLMGEAWEPVNDYTDCQPLEAAYQAFKAR